MEVGGLHGALDGGLGSTRCPGWRLGVCTVPWLEVRGLHGALDGG